LTTVKFFGTSAAIPSIDRGFACIGVSEDPDGKSAVLLDCGDGSLKNLLKLGRGVDSVEAIVLSHYHSDHLSGIAQVVETMGIRKREKNLRVFGPTGLKEYFATIQKITNVASKRSFKIELSEIEPGQKFEAADYSVETYKMEHTIPCNGYRLILPGGKILAYTGDTMLCEALKSLGDSADLFIHEATYLHRDIELAKPPKHSTALQAAVAAKAAKAKLLVLTHVNEENETPDEMLKEAKTEFPNAKVAYDGFSLEI
jgi:ribonuclease Z